MDEKYFFNPGIAGMSKRDFMARMRTRGSKFAYTRAFSLLKDVFKKINGRDPFTKEMLSLTTISDLIVSEISTFIVSQEVEETDTGEWTALAYFIRLNLDVEEWFKNNRDFVYNVVESITIEVNL